MKLFAYGWAVFSGLVTLAVAYSVLNAFSSQFEKIVVDILVLTYLSIRLDHIYHDVVWSQANQENIERHEAILKALGIEPRETREAGERILKEGQTRYREMVQSSIKGVLLILVSLLAFLHLIVDVYRPL